VKKLFKTALPIIVLFLGIGIVQVLVAAKPAPEKKEESQRLVSLYVDEVEADQVKITVEAQGEVRPKTEIELVPQVSGRIVMISDQFQEGAEFGPDTVLLKIDDSDYRLAVIKAEARVATAQTNVEEQLATQKIKEQQWATKGGNAEPTPFALNVPQVNQARAQLASAEAELQEARLDLERTEIRVPFHGRVRARNTGLGQIVSAGMSLGRVFSVDTVEVRLPLTDTQLVELNLPMGFTAEAGAGPLVNFKAEVGNESYFWQGRIRRVNAAVDQDTRLIYATAEVEDPYGKAAAGGMPMAVGLFVSAEIAGADQRSVYVMPRRALRNEDKVYVINDESRLEIRTVNVLSTSEELVYVTSGVEPGEQVVTSTIPAAVDGMQVEAIKSGRQS
jgi:RND family efflux transporter MFP subunit